MHRREIFHCLCPLSSPQPPPLHLSPPHTHTLWKQTKHEEGKGKYRNINARDKSIDGGQGTCNKGHALYKN